MSSSTTQPLPVRDGLLSKNQPYNQAPHVGAQLDRPRTLWAWIPSQILMMPVFFLLGVMIETLIFGTEESDQPQIIQHFTVGEQSLSHTIIGIILIGAIGFVPIYALCVFLSWKRYPGRPLYSYLLWSLVGPARLWGYIFTASSTLMGMMPLGIFMLIVSICAGLTLTFGYTIGIAPILVLAFVIMAPLAAMGTRYGWNQYGLWAKHNPAVGGTVAIGALTYMGYAMVRGLFIAFIAAAPYFLTYAVIGTFKDNVSSAMTGSYGLFYLAAIYFLAIGLPSLVEYLARIREGRLFTNQVNFDAYNTNNMAGDMTDEERRITAEVMSSRNNPERRKFWKNTMPVVMRGFVLVMCSLGALIWYKSQGAHGMDNQAPKWMLGTIIALGIVELIRLIHPTKKQKFLGFVAFCLGLSCAFFGIIVPIVVTAYKSIARNRLGDYNPLLK